MGSAAIPLQVQTPKIASPLQTIGGIMQLRGQMAEIALRNQQIEQSKQQEQLIQAEQSQKNRDLNDQNTLQDLEKDPENFRKIYAGDLSPLAGKVQSKTLQTIQTNVNDAITKKATNTTAQLAQEATAHANIGKTLNSFQQMTLPDGTPDLARINESFGAAKQALMPEFKILGIDPSQVPGSINSADDLSRIAAQSGAAGALTDAALARRKTEAETAADVSRGKASQAEADIKTFDLKLRQGASSGDLAASVDTLLPAAKYPEQNADAKAAGALALKYGGPDAANRAVQEIYSQIGGAKKITAETPAKVAEQAAMLPGEVRKAGATAMAAVPAHVAGAVQAQQALAKLSPDAFATVPDATSRHAAMNEYDKVSQAYTDKLATTQQLIDSISLAQKGNKAAPGVIPLAELRGFVNRVNTAELNAVSTNAGSLLDRIQGHINKATEGQPIPPDILKDMKVLATLQTQAAKRGYDSGLQRLKTRGVDVSKIETPTISGSGGTVKLRAPDGSVSDVPEDQVDHYLKLGAKRAE